MSVVLALLIALLCLFFLLKSWLSERPALRRMRARHSQSEFRLNNLQAVLSAYPGMAMVWEHDTKTAGGRWTEPRIMGSPATMAAIQSALDIGTGQSFPDAVLTGLSDLKVSAMSPNNKLSFKPALLNLLDKGQNFSACLDMPQGHNIDIEGRVANGQAILWIDDQSVHGPDEQHAMRRIDMLDLQEEQDLVVFIEMVNRSPFPVWRVNAKGRLVWINPAYVRSVGSDRAQDVISQQIFLDDTCVKSHRTCYYKRSPAGYPYHHYSCAGRSRRICAGCV